MSEPSNLLFRRSDLAGLPEPVLPAGYTLRSGGGVDDGRAWCELITAAFEQPTGADSWQREILAWEGYRPEGLQFIHDAAGQAVATALAARRGGPQSGYLHWVASHPAARGLGLGRAVTVAALQRLAADGCRDCVLITQPERRPAIALYRALGFELLAEAP